MPATDLMPTQQAPTDNVCQVEMRCSQIKTRTVVTNLGPMSAQQLQQAIADAVGANEAAGFLVLAHSLVDTGGGWMAGLTVGWYEAPGT